MIFKKKKNPAQWTCVERMSKWNKWKSGRRQNVSLASKSKHKLDLPMFYKRERQQKVIVNIETVSTSLLEKIVYNVLLSNFQRIRNK